MGHLPSLIADLALILITGAITTILFRKIKQPLVLGYIIAGFLVGPHISLTPTVVDTANIKTLAEIGVIFLLFSLGLEFSFRKLKRVGSSASITALFEIVFITTTGYLLGKMLGWSDMDSLFLGGMIASSSTTIIIKAFDELGVKMKRYTHVVFGILIVEDIVVIILMVLLSTIALTNQFEGAELVTTVLRLLFFLVLWFITGIFLLPTFLKRAKGLLNDETLLILSIGLCLGMVVIATQVGFSAELGAFIMGSVLAETTSAEKVEHLIKPVKDLFGAVFFVSVGMLIDPDTIIEYRWPVLWVTLLVLFGKLISTTAGALLSGQPLKQSIQIGMSMAQVGEFAFIVASLGLSLGVTSEFLFPVAVGASAITTFTTPYMIKFSSTVYSFSLKTLPVRWIDALNNYSTGTQIIKTETNFKKVLTEYIYLVIANGIIILGIIFLSLELLVPFMREQIRNPMLNSISALVVTFAAITPFLWALMVKPPRMFGYKELWLDKKYSKGPLLMVEIARIVVGILIMGFLVDKLFSPKIAMFTVVPVSILVLIIFSNRIQKFYQRLELRFLSNLNAKESEEMSATDNILRKQFISHTDSSLWNAHLVDMIVDPHAKYIGKTLMKLAWREKFGINIAYIKRGETLIYAPGRFSRLFAFDHVGILGTDEQIQAFRPVFEARENSINTEQTVEDVILQQIVVNEHNQLKGLTIRDSGIRELTNGLIVGIERKQERILNPGSDTIFDWGDIVWIVGERSKIQKLTVSN